MALPPLADDTTRTLVHVELRWPRDPRITPPTIVGRGSHTCARRHMVAARPRPHNTLPVSARSPGCVEPACLAWLTCLAWLLPRLARLVRLRQLDDELVMRISPSAVPRETSTDAVCVQTGCGARGRGASGARMSGAVLLLRER